STTIDTPNGLTIVSSALGTGSLITGSITGTGNAENYLTTGRWHLVSSPVVETVAAFLTANSNVPNNLPTNANRGMMDYNPGSNSWNAFFTDGVSAGSAGSGKAYCLRSAANGIVTFTGTLQAGTLHATGLTSGAFNCVGNPYTSAIGINQTATSSNNFLGVNSANLDATYGAVYLWDNADAQNGTGAYTAVSNVPSATIANIAQGQGFMVKMASATQVDFNSLMQVHAPSLALKSANKIWPTIKLTATVNNIQNSTVIAYDGGMSKGLDPTYDAGLFKGGADLVIYTKLVEDSATPLAIQALPDNNYNDMIIPVGVDSKTGGQVVFSAETFSLPTGVKVILEDKVAKTFTDLATTTYKAVLVPNSIVADRFQLHNSTSTIQGNIGDPTLGGKLTAYAYMNSEIRIVGQVSKDAVATLYDVQGKSVIITKLAEGSLNVIPISSVSTGLYLLSVKDGVNSQSFKILLKD
ncbi:MAG: T9SS type A sorting domain-containing protein, partial [Mariniphaga sp.]